MGSRNKLLQFYDRLLTIDSDDSDDARRRRLLNIVLLGFLTLTVILIVIFAIYLAISTQAVFSKDIQIIFIMAGGLLIGTAVIYILIRYLRGGIASIIFLSFLVIIFNFADSPDQLANGRSIILFCIPIIMASILVRPILSFFFAGIASFNIVMLSIWTNYPPNFPAITVFFLLALVSWLAARSLEQALRDLRHTNANLDKLVRERTRELAGALARERVEAGKSKAILDSIADGVIVFDVNGTAIVVNPSLLVLLNKGQDSIRNMTIDELTHSKGMDAKSRDILTGLLANPGEPATSYRINWDSKTLSVSSSRVLDTDGARIGTVAVFRDFTREAEVERMKDTFLAVVSHELRTPLNAILGYAEMLKEAIYGQLNQRQGRATDRIISNSQRLLGIVSDLLDQAQMEAGKLTILNRPFKPRDLIENVHIVMDKIAADKGLTLKSECDPDLPEFIMGDQARLQQVLVNLINNSVKFTPDGSVTFRLQKTKKKKWAMEVQDTGIGIPKEELSRIFEVFHQVDGTASREHGGFGLGLSIVKQLTVLMKGEVTAQSQMKKGSTFRVLLPLNLPRKTASK